MEPLIAFFTTPDLPQWAFWLIVAVSFLGSAMTAALSIGGGLLVIAVMSAVMPATAVIPIHGVVMLGSNGGRSFVLRNHIDWTILLSFATGSALGAAVGGFVVTGMPASALRLCIAGFIIFTQWGPKIDIPLTRNAFRWVGGFSMMLTLFVGATGPFVTALLGKKKDFSRFQMTATAGSCMCVQHGFKVAVFAIGGFAFAPYAGLIALCLASGFAGTVLGAKLLNHVPEALFRRLLKWILTALAGYLAAMAIIALVS